MDLSPFHLKDNGFMCSNFSALVFGQLPPDSYNIDLCLYLEKVMVLPQIIMWSSELLIRFALKKKWNIKESIS
jgi:hypothetical protein